MRQHLIAIVTVVLLSNLVACPASAWAAADPTVAPAAALASPGGGDNQAAVHAFEAEARLLESIGLTDKQRAILQRGADQARAAKDPAEQERILTATMCLRGGVAMILWSGITGQMICGAALVQTHLYLIYGMSAV